MSICQEVEQLLRSSTSVSDPTELVRFEQHLEVCPRCMRVLTEVHGSFAAFERASRSALKGAGAVKPVGEGPHFRDKRAQGVKEGRKSSHADDPYATRLADDGFVLAPGEPAGGEDRYATAFAGGRAGFHAGDGPELRAHPEPPEPPPNWPVIPGYDLITKLGEGGMGVVFHAVQRRLNRPVALKMIRGDGLIRESQLQRFPAEAEAVARLRHPNIVQIYEIGDVNGLPYFSLELLEGGALDTKLAGTPQPARESAVLIATLASALHAAHEARIVHRDLKPANIVLAGDGTPKITDFGLAKRLQDDDISQTRPGDIMGSPCYMAPEQARGDNAAVGPAADIYSLGAILYELLTGRPPFRGISVWDTVQQVIEQEPVAPSRLQPRVPRDLETICLKCLSKEQGRRYPSARLLGEDVQRYLDGIPILARPLPFWSRAVKWVRRRPAAAALVLMASICSAGAIASALVYRDGLLASRNRERDLDSQALIDAVEAKARANELLKTAPDQVEGALGGPRQTLRNRLRFRSAQARLGPAPADLDALIRQLDREAGNLDALIQQGQTAASGRRDLQEFQANLARFRGACDQALYLAIDLLDLNSTTRAGAGGRTATDHATDALGVFAERDAAGRWTFRPGFPGRTIDPAADAEIDDGLVAMLLILAHAAERPVPGDAATAGAARALQVLEAGSPLRRPTSPTRTYHRRKAAYLRTLDRPAEAEREAALGAATGTRTNPYDTFLQGLEAFRNRDFAAAIDLFLDVRRRDPASFWARALLANSYLQQNDLRAAKLILDECLLRRPDEAWLLILRGYASGLAAPNGAARVDRSNRAGDPLAAIRQAIDAPAAPGSTRPAEPPGDAAARQLRRAQVARAEEDFAAAAARLSDQPQDLALRYALQVNWGLVLRGDPEDRDRAITHFEAAIALDDQQPGARMGLAVAAWQQGQFGRAIEAATPVIERAGPGARRGNALVLRAMAHDAAARTLGDAAGRLTAGQAWPGIERGAGWLRGRGEHESLAAIADLGAAIQETGAAERAALQAMQAGWLFRLGHRDEALAAAAAALAIDPDSAEALRWQIAATLAQPTTTDITRRAVIDACDRYLRAARSRPVRPDQLAAIYRICGQNKTRLRQFAEAIPDYSAALDRTLPGDDARVDLLVERGWAYLWSDAIPLAMADFDAAADLRPGDLDITLAQANVAAQQRDAKVALGQVERAESLPGQTHLTRYREARVYAVVDQQKRALARRDGAFSPPRHYSQQAIGLLTAAFGLLEPAERSRFFHDVIAKDQAFATLRQFPEFAHLARQVQPEPQPRRSPEP